MHAIEEEYLTVAEAAALLRVAPSTIRRWIREGDLPAYRLGRRRVGLRRTDLSALVKPAKSVEDQAGINGDHAEIERIKRRKLTTEEVERGLAALEAIQRINEQIRARRGGKPFSPSWEIINEMRDERTRELS